MSCKACQRVLYYVKASLLRGIGKPVGKEITKELAKECCTMSRQVYCEESASPLAKRMPTKLAKESCENALALCIRLV